MNAGEVKGDVRRSVDGEDDADVGLEVDLRERLGRSARRGVR